MADLNLISGFPNVFLIFKISSIVAFSKLGNLWNMLNTNPISLIFSESTSEIFNFPSFP